MTKFVNKILEKIVGISKSQRKFILEVLKIRLIGHGKMNFRNMSRYSSYNEKTISRNHEQPFNFAEFNGHAVSEIITKDTRSVAAYDASFIKKSGKKTEGIGYFWDGSNNKAEKGLEIGCLAVIDVDNNTAYAISAEQTISNAESSKDIAEKTRIDAYLKHASDHKKYLPMNVGHLVGDGFFAKEKFVKGVKSVGLEFVGKLRIDANLRYLYEGPQKDKGRPKKYDSKVDIEDLTKLDFVKTILDESGEEVRIYTKLVYCIFLKMTIRIAFLLKSKDKKRIATAILFTTDLALQSSDIYAFYKARYQIEFLFRDAKQFTGLNDCQARTKEKLNFHFNVSFSALNIVKIEDHLNQKEYNSKNSFSMASWKRIYSNEHFIHKVFSMFEFDLSLIKSTPHFEELRNYGTISNVT